jgi:hypothetical protein
MPRNPDEYVSWTDVGYLTGNVDFAQSDIRFQNMFAPGDYYAIYEQTNDCWHFTMRNSGEFRYPHYTVNYTGNGAETKNEHFTYKLGKESKRIFASNVPQNSSKAKDFINKILCDVLDAHPEFPQLQVLCAYMI